MDAEEKKILEGQLLKGNQKKYILPQQSANVLFKFMGELKFLIEIIEKKAILPRYYEEITSYLEIGVDSIAFPMSCFCDINLQKLLPHVKNYGSYGIGLDKVWGINQGIQPIQYINSYSPIRKDYTEVFNDSLQRANEDAKVLSKHNDYLLTQLLFMKPLEGEMLSSGEYIRRNFHDEKEWRFIPDINNGEKGLPLLIPKEQMNPRAYYMYSEGIKKDESLWLKLEYESIKYVIVKTLIDREVLISFIIEKLAITEIEKGILISKVMVLDEIKEDW